jgi:tetraspanin-13/31
MLILFLLFLVQFSVACACLAFNTEQQYQLAKQVLYVTDEKNFDLDSCHCAKYNIHKNITAHQLNNFLA